MSYYPRISAQVFLRLDFFFKASLSLEEEPCVARAFVDRKVEGEVRCLQVDHQDEADGELHRSKAENQEGERGQEEVVEDGPEDGRDEEEEGPHELGGQN